MIASRNVARPEVAHVTVQCKVPGGPWYVGLGGFRVPEIELGPYENPAVAREDAAKLRQFFAMMIPDDSRCDTPLDWVAFATTVTGTATRTR